MQRRADEDQRWQDWQHGPVLVGTDGSPTATAAVEVAARLAMTGDHELIIVSGYRTQRRSFLRILGLAGPPDLGTRSQEASEASTSDEVVLRAIEVAHIATGGAVRAQGRSELGDPADVLLQLADDVDAAWIVIGNAGLTGLTKRWTTPHRVLRRAHCRVLMVDTQDWARRGGPANPPTHLTVRRCA